MRRTALQGRHHIVQSRGAQRGHDADGPGQQRQGFFAVGIEQALGLQPDFELQKFLEQVALPGLLHGFDDQLQFAARLVDAEPAAHLDQLPVTRRKIQQPSGAPEHRAAHLPLLVFQRKITMAAGRPCKATDFAPHGHRVETRLQAVGNRAQQRADRPDTHARRRPLRFDRRLKHHQTP